MSERAKHKECGSVNVADSFLGVVCLKCKKYIGINDITSGYLQERNKIYYFRRVLTA